MFVGLIFFLYFVPAETLALIDNMNIKALLLAISFLLLSTIGILLYWTFHIPTVRRLIVVGWRAVLLYSAVACSFSVFGWSRIRSIELSEQTGLQFQFSPAEVASEVWPNLAVCFLGISVMTTVYVVVGVIETKYGKDLK